MLKIRAQISLEKYLDEVYRRRLFQQNNFVRKVESLKVETAGICVEPYSNGGFPFKLNGKKTKETKKQGTSEE